MRRMVFLMAAAMIAAPAFAKSSFAGHYRLRDGPDVVAELILKDDGRFEYRLAAGALDEQSAGRWVEQNGKVTLHTEPKPKPPVFSYLPRNIAGDEPFRLLVTWPNGRGIAGVDFLIGFDSGNDVSGYTQEYGWTPPDDDRRVPRWVELTEPIHRVKSPRFKLSPGGRPVTFVLTPNDMGTVDLDGAMIERGGKDGADIVLHRREGDMKFVRVTRSR